VLEARARPRAQPGETLHPGAESILKQLGVWDSLLQCGFHRHHGIWRESQEGIRIFDPYGTDAEGAWLGFQVDRARFHELLRDRVAQLGGTIIEAGRLNELLIQGERVTGIRANDCNHEARFVLDATGRLAWVAEKLQLQTYRPEPEQRLQFGWSDNAPADLNGQPLFRQRNDGWDWLAPLGDGRSAWVQLRRFSRNAGIDYTWRVFSKSAGPGYFLLGDAACVMDPATSNGVLRAMMSGILAVKFIEAMQSGRLSEMEACSEYVNWVARLFEHHHLNLNVHGSNEMSKATTRTTAPAESPSGSGYPPGTG
jgi:flavin-dependent dehydrogenase